MGNYFQIDDHGCVLCGHLKFGGCDITDHIEQSQHSYADVLQRLFGATDEDKFESGKLCTICKIRLQNLYRLQKELREEKSEIMKIFKESQNIRKERNVEKNVKEIFQEMKSAKKKTEISKSRRKMFKNKSDSLLDYGTSTDIENNKDLDMDDNENSVKLKSSVQRTPEQNNKSNIKRFTIHSLKKRRNDSYLVKWVGFSDEENTWESRDSIPDYIIKVSH